MTLQAEPTDELHSYPDDIFNVNPVSRPYDEARYEPSMSIIRQEHGEYIMQPRTQAGQSDLLREPERNVRALVPCCDVCAGVGPVGE
jgi:hypothetical protein